MHGSRGCLGCCTKPQLIIAVDEPSKRLKIQGRAVKKSSLPDDSWSSSTYEMDNSAVQSQRSISSMSNSNQNADPHGVIGSTSNPSEPVNSGVHVWNQLRQQWVGDRKSRSQPKIREPKLSWNATYESLLGTNKPFPQPVPLPEMVEFLVDVWEQEDIGNLAIIAVVVLHLVVRLGIWLTARSLYINTSPRHSDLGGNGWSSIKILISSSVSVLTGLCFYFLRVNEQGQGKNGGSITFAERNNGECTKWW